MAAACGRSVRHESSSSSLDGGAGERALTGGSGGTAAAGGKGGGPGSGGTAGDTEPPPTGFRIEGGDFDLELAECSALDEACLGRAGCGIERRVFVMRDRGELLLVYASQGDMNILTLEPAGDHFVVDKSLYLTYLHEPYEPPVSLTAGPFDVWFSDADADGVADTIRLEARGTCENGTGDVESLLDVSVTLTASDMPSTPQLAVQGDGWLAPVELHSNEPLDLASSVALVASDGSRWNAGAVSRRSLFVTGFTVPDDLPPSTDFTFQIDAWNPTGGRAPSELPFRTFDAWSPLDDLGFEHGVDAHVIGTSLYACDQPTDTPRLTTSIGDVGPLEGEVSLLVPYGQNVGVLLDRPAGATKLRLSVLPLYARTANHDSLRIYVGNRRGKSTFADTTLADERTETDSGVYPLAGPVERLELPLPEESGDLLLEIDAPCMPQSVTPFATAAWVDALEFE